LPVVVHEQSNPTSRHSNLYILEISGHHYKDYHLRVMKLFYMKDFDSWVVNY
jgi:hypothetical protein